MLKSALLLHMVSCLQLSATLIESRVLDLRKKKKKKEKIKGGTNSKLQQQKKEVISVPLETLDEAGCDYSLKYKCLKSRNIKRF